MSDEKPPTNVIHLAYSSPEVQEEVRSMFACSFCHNKTFTLSKTSPVDDYPLLACAACGNHIGHVGWTP